MECFSLKFIRKNARKLLLIKFSVCQFPKRYVMKKLPKIGLNKFCKCVSWSRIFVGEAFERICSIKMAEKLSTIGATTLSIMTHSILTFSIMINET